MLQKMTFRVFSVALILAAVGMPLAGCGGVETEPIGVENTDADLEMLETEEYMENERRLEQQR